MRGAADNGLRRKRILGILTILVGAIVLIVAAIRPQPFRDEVVVYAEFDNVNGLGSIDRDIRVAGVNSGSIGEVERIGDNALVELDIDPDVVLHADAQVALRPHTLFEGSAFVDLHPGSPSAPLIEDGATIPLKRTRIYVSLDEAVRVLKEPAREALRELIRVGAEATSGESIEALQRTLKAAPGLTRELGPTARALQGPGGDELSGAIAGAARTVDALAARESSLIPLAQRTNATLEAIDVDGGRALDRALAELPPPLETLAARGETVTELIDRVDRLSVELAPALVEFAPALEQLQPLLRDSAPVIERAVPLVQSTGKVLARAANAAPTLIRLLDIVGPGTEVFAEKVLPAFDKKSRLGLPTYLQLVSAFAGGDAALRAYQTAAQGSLGAGHMIRLGAHFDSGSLTRLPCDAIAQLAPGLAASLGGLGLCDA